MGESLCAIIYSYNYASNHFATSRRLAHDHFGRHGAAHPSTPPSCFGTRRATDRVGPSLDASSHAIVLWFLSLGRCPPCSLLTLHRPPRTPNRGRLHPPTGSSSTFRLCSRKALNPSDVTRCALAVFRYEKVMFQMIFLYLTTLARTSGAPHRPPRLQSRLLDS